jgi:hypothetical protein
MGAKKMKKVPDWLNVSKFIVKKKEINSKVALIRWKSRKYCK